jgi:hypothetical protein
MPWVAAAGAAVLAFGEVQAWRTSRADYPTAPTAGPASGRDVVLVLGFRSRADGRLNALQAWRTRIAVRSAPPDALFVFSGGTVRGTEPEAVVMARHATVRLGVPPDAVAIESAAESTREPVVQPAVAAGGPHHPHRLEHGARPPRPRLPARARSAPVGASSPHPRLPPARARPLRLALTFYDFVAARSAGRAAAMAAANRAVIGVRAGEDAVSGAQRSGATEA